MSKKKPTPPRDGRDAWSEGYEAAIHYNIEDNPYNAKTEPYCHGRWRSGYYDRSLTNPEDNYCGGY